MARFRDRYDPLRLFFKRVGTLALLILVVFVGLGVWKVFSKERESRALRVEAEIQEARLKEQADQLEAKTAQLKTDRGKEALLRDQYDVGRSGEGLIVIVEPPAPEPIAPEPTFLDKVRKFFFFW